MTKEQILEQAKKLTDKDKKWLIEEIQKNIRIWITKEDFDETDIYYAYVVYLRQEDEQRYQQLLKEAKDKNIDHGDYIVEAAKRDERFQKWWEKDIEKMNETIRKNGLMINTGIFSSFIED